MKPEALTDSHVDAPFQRWGHKLKNLFIMSFYGPVNSMGSCGAQSNHTFTGQFSKLLTSIVHILMPETDNWP